VPDHCSCRLYRGGNAGRSFIGSLPRDGLANGLSRVGHAEHAQQGLDQTVEAIALEDAAEVGGYLAQPRDGGVERLDHRHASKHPRLTRLVRRAENVADGIGRGLRPCCSCAQSVHEQSTFDIQVL